MNLIPIKGLASIHAFALKLHTSFQIDALIVVTSDIRVCTDRQTNRGSGNESCYSH